MPFPKSIYELTKVLPKKDREKVRNAMLEFYFDGTEPCGLSENARRVFEGVRGRLHQSRVNSMNRGGESAMESGNETPMETANETAMETDYERRTDGATKPPTKPRPEGEGEGEIEGEEGKGRARFRAPAPAEVAAYARGAGLSLDAERFCDFYASKGWRVGRSPMKDWKAAARNWARRDEPAKAARFDEYA